MLSFAHVQTLWCYSDKELRMSLRNRTKQIKKKKNLGKKNNYLTLTHNEVAAIGSIHVQI